MTRTFAAPTSTPLEIARLVGRAVSRRRRALRISTKALATRAEIAAVNLPLIEGGHRMPSLPELFRLARALRVHPGELLAAPQEPSEVVETAWGELEIGAKEVCGE